MGRAAVTVDIRRASLSDSPLVLAWRNDPTTVATSFTGRPVATDEHERWFASSLTRADRRLLMVLVDGRACGVVRFDLRQDGSWETSINLAPASRGQGLSSEALRAAHRWFAQEVGGGRFVAFTRPSNTASQRAFVRAGYQEVGRDDERVCLELVQSPMEP